MQKIPMCSATNPQAEIYHPLACMVDDHQPNVWHAPSMLTIIGLVMVAIIIGTYARRVYKEKNA